MPSTMVEVPVLNLDEIDALNSDRELRQAFHRRVELKQLQDTLELEMLELNATIAANLDFLNIKSVVVDNCLVSYVKAGKSKTFDQSKFQVALFNRGVLPDVIEEAKEEAYTMKSRAMSVRVMVLGKDEEEE